MNLCIHGHFYQPPREDPISNYIPDEIGAEPFGNWNERILAECYAPNARSGSFQKISFNVGPTLMRWMDSFAGETYTQIIAQEQWNYANYGVGNGMAQSYNHSILPLANAQDKITQVRWGIKDFELRFGHQPAGMWLPETAVDTATLCALADQGIKFTILAPWQVISEDGGNGPFLIDLPDGRDPFVVFTYNQELSTRVSFHPSSTVNGDLFLESILNDHANDDDGLLLVASDGELYGHHQPFRDLFLSYVLNGAADKRGVQWTYPGKWLKEHNVTQKGRLVENTSWSCMHGVDRWERVCGCTPKAYWKNPFRAALNQIGEWLDAAFIDVAAPLFPELWELRHRYIDVINGRMTTVELCQELSKGRWRSDQLPRIEDLLSAQYERQRMFTSCGFFHDEFHRIEPQNNIAYAAKAVFLTERATGLDLVPAALSLLSLVQSQKTGLRGDTVFSQTLLRAKEECVS